MSACLILPFLFCLPVMPVGSSFGPTMAFLSQQSCRDTTALAVPSCHISIVLPVHFAYRVPAVLPMAVLSRLSFASSLVLAAQPYSTCLVLPIRFCLPCFACLVLPDLFCPICFARPDFPVLLCQSCSDFLFCLSSSACSVLPHPFFLTCSACPVRPVLFCCSVCPLLPVLS